MRRIWVIFSCMNNSFWMAPTPPSTDQIWSNQPQIPSSRFAKIHPKHFLQLHSPALLIVPQQLTFTNQFRANAFKDDILDYIKIITGPLTIIPEQPEWFPIGITPIMWFSAGICHVLVIVTDVFNLLEIWFQNFDISIDEWAIIFFLVKIESGVIRCSHFGWSFHGGCPFCARKRSKYHQNGDR